MSRRAFTLIEILVVLIVIAVLTALLLPAIFRAQLRARLARTNVEITLLSHALEAFKTQYGIYPPSRILLYERPAILDGSGKVMGTRYNLTGTDFRSRLEQRTVHVFQKIWPDFPILTCRFDFDGDNNLVPDQSYVDFNGNGSFDDVLDLSGPECLTFFLGGMPLPYVYDSASGSDRRMQASDSFADVENGGRRGFEGFSRNPIFPFSRQGDTFTSTATGMTAPVPGHDDRFAPWFEFSTDRLMDLNESPNTLGSNFSSLIGPDGVWEFLDHLQAGRESPYLYFSSYEGTGYNSANELEFLSLPPENFQVWVAFGDSASASLLPESAGDNAFFIPYYLGAPVADIDNDGNLEIIQTLIEWNNKRSFQIISPGVDGIYGYGGQYRPDI